MRARWVALAACLAALASCKKSEAPPEPKSAPPSADQPATPTAAPAPLPPGQGAAAPAPEPALSPPKEQEAPKTDEKKKDALAAPETLAAAEKQLDQALADLKVLTGGRSGSGGSAAPLAAGDSRCADACKAMESLRRAAAAVCRLAGEENARCARAKGIVKDSEVRVAACKCEPPKD